MNETQLLALLANEIDSMDNTRFDSKLKALAYNRLSQQEIRELEAEAKDNPQLQLLLNAFSPIENSRMSKIEDNLIESFFTNDQGHEAVRSGVTNQKKPSAESDLPEQSQREKNNTLNRFEFVSRLRSKLKSFTHISIAASLIACVSLVLISLNFTPVTPLPSYSFEVSGFNKKYRSYEPVEPSSQNNVLEFFPGNHPAILLRPEKQVHSDVDVFILLEYNNQIINIKSSFTQASSGSFKAFPVFDGVFTNGKANPSTLIAVISKLGETPETELIQKLLNKNVKSYHSNDWLYLTQPIIIHSQ